jgi:diaminohydroxyphosphoribosylaminopyrimidine deaminase / 5-amino-6-(5-phosphoribosylamino)uracil reductase
LLTVRIANQSDDIIKQPLRIVITARGGLPLHLNIFNQNQPSKTLVITTSAADQAWCQKILANNIDLWIAPSTDRGLVHIPALLAELGRRGISSLLVEGGMNLHHQFISENLVNRIQVYLAPCIIGSLERKRFLSEVACTTMQGDYLFSATTEEMSDV